MAQPATPNPTQAKFLQGSLLKHIIVMSLTSSVGLMAIFLVDLVDMIFISMLGHEELAAAIGYAGAILFFTTSFGIGMSIAAGALVARALGEGDPFTARRRAATALLYGIVLGGGFAALIWTFVPQLTALLGASGETLSLASNYLRIVLPSMPILAVGMIGGAILRAHGDARRAMVATIAGGVVNAVLDPILIFGLNLELTGAAVASVFARITIAVMSVYPLLRHHGGLDRPDPAGFRVDFPVIMAIALPAILTQFATPLGQAYVTRAMAEFGEDAVAGMAIVGRLLPVSFAVIFALSGAIGPIVGQNFGAGQMDRVRRALRDGLIFVLCVTVGVSTILYLARAPIADLFSAKGLTRDLVYLFCGPLSLAWFFNGVIFVTNAGFNNLGRPFYSTMINWGRQTLGTIPLVIIGASVWGAPGVLIGQAAGGLVFAAIALALSARVLRIAEHGRYPSEAQPYQRLAKRIALFHFRR
ncbi:MATE family efflux transporter [uncultured Aliiroseovarius sp.]|uniref:MATE family efflux transporter n=1 Tax=uncultured Aliiroseovarius sp. TaxID=1658783 RepID=UPI002596069A|nr:MATE family efflux transporter [uncultured Aliiroseovarius sp.]